MCKIQTCRVKIVYIILWHPLQMLKSCERTMSPLSNVLKREGMCWLSGVWQTMLRAEVHRVTFWSSDMAMSGNPFSHSTNIFQAHISLQTNYFYTINQRRNGYTLIPLQKRQQHHNYRAPLRSERSRSCYLIQTEDSHFTHQLNFLSTDSSREGVSCCNYSFPNWSYW